MTSVLFVRLSAMGDLVQGLGAILAVHRARPDWRLTIATQTTFAPLLDGLAGVERVVTLARRGGWRAVRKLRDELKQDRYDFALDLQGNWKSAAVALLSGARQRLGAAGPWRQEPRSRFLLHRSIAVPGNGHPAVVAWTLARELVAGLPFELPVLVATAAERERESRAVCELGIDPGRPFRVLVVTDPSDPRALRPESLAAEAAASPEPVLHLLGPAETGVGMPATARLLRHGPGEARRLIALGALVAQAGGLVVGPDQGACHVLAAAGARCFVLFGAQDPHRTAPPAATALVHRSPPPCSPCRQTVCTNAAGPICMAFSTATGQVVTGDLPKSEP